MTHTEKTTTTKRITKEEKKLLQKKTNRENLTLATGAVLRIWKTKTLMKTYGLTNDIWSNNS